MATDITRNPLTAADKRNLQQSLYALKQNTLNIDRAEAGGMDVSEARMVNDSRVEAVTKMLNAFFPEG